MDDRIETELSPKIINTMIKLDWATNPFDAKTDEEVNIVLGEEVKLEDLISSTHGPTVEIGGPTEGGYHMGKDTTWHPVPDYITNVSPERPTLYGQDIGSQDINLILEADKMPFAAASVGVVFASNLPREVRMPMFQEVCRVLEDGGYLVYQGGLEEDIKKAGELGFTVEKYYRKYKHGLCNIVLKNHQNPSLSKS